MKATRREFLKIFSIGALATAINPLNAIAGNTRTLDVVLSDISVKEKAVQVAPKNAELRYDLYDLFGEAASLANDTQKKALELKGKLSFNSGVSLDMAKKTVDEILAPQYKSGSIVQVKYDSKKGVSNFDRLVYQRDVKASDRMPVLAMFYVNHDIENKDPAKAGSSKREAIVLKNLVRKYKGKIKFVVHEADVDTVKARKNYTGLNRDYNVKGIPSIAMYSPWDVVKGETRDKNNGKMTQVDVLRGGPKDNNTLIRWMPSMDPYWIKPNLTKPNGKWVRRFSNRKNSSSTKIIYNK